MRLGKVQAAGKQTPGLGGGRAFLCLELAAAEGEAEGGLLLRVGACGKAEADAAEGQAGGSA